MKKILISIIILSVSFCAEAPYKKVGNDMVKLKKETQKLKQNFMNMKNSTGNSGELKKQIEDGIKSINSIEGRLLSMESHVQSAGAECLEIEAKMVDYRNKYYTDQIFIWGIIISIGLYIAFKIYMNFAPVKQIENINNLISKFGSFNKRQ